MTEEEEEWPEHECVTCMEGMDELVAKGQSWSCECCGFMVGTQDDHEYCGKNIDGTIVCNHCYDGGHKVTTMITLDGNEVIFNSTCQGEGNEKRLGDREYEITEEYVFGSEEGSAPIQDPMEFGEMANWTPLDGSEGLKRKRAEAIKVESVGAEEDIRMIYVRTREAAEEEAEKFIRHYFPADMKYAYQINATDEPNRWEMLYEQIPQGMESTYSAESFEADFDYYYTSYDKGRGMGILDRLRTMNPETKAEALDWLIDNGYLHSEEVYDSAYINAMGDALYITSDEDITVYDAEMVTGDEVFTEAERNKDYQPYRSPGMMSYSQMTPSDMKRLGFAHTFIQPQNTHKMMRELNLSGNVNPPLRKLDMLNGWMDKAIDDAYQDATGKTIYEAQGSPSATIPVKGSETSWVKPMATALGFALGFFGIHEIKKVL